MVYEFEKKRVKEWLNESEPKPIKLQISPLKHKGRLSVWRERQRRAKEGRVFSMPERDFIRGVVRQYGQAAVQAPRYNSVPALQELLEVFDSVQIGEEVKRVIEIERAPEKGKRLNAGVIVEHVLYPNGVIDNEFIGGSKIDFDSGKAFQNPIEWQNSVHLSAWMNNSGVDAMVQHPIGNRLTISGNGMTVIGVDPEFWDNPPTSWESLEEAEIEKGFNTAHGGAFQRTYFIDVDQMPPITFGFKTREGGIGLLQVLDTVPKGKQPRGVRIRYQLLDSKASDF